MSSSLNTVETYEIENFKFKETPNKFILFCYNFTQSYSLEVESSAPVHILKTKQNARWVNPC